MEPQETFVKLKKAIRLIVDKYGTSKIKYAVIPFGALPVTKISFEDKFPNVDSLKQAIQGIIRPQENGNLKKLLTEAKGLFTRSSARPWAKKVLLVVMDKKSTSKLQEVKDEANLLKEDGVKIVAVALGKSFDSDELESVTSNRGYLIKAPKNRKAETLANLFMDAILKGKVLIQFLCEIKRF